MSPWTSSFRRSPKLRRYRAGSVRSSPTHQPALAGNSEPACAYPTAPTTSSTSAATQSRLRRRVRHRPLLVGTGDPHEQRILRAGVRRGRGSAPARRPPRGRSPEHFGTDEQRATSCRRWHGATTSGPTFSEPDAGSDLTGSRPRAAGTVTTTWWWVRRSGHVGPWGGLRLPAGAHRAGRRPRRHLGLHPRHAVPAWTCDRCAR